MKPQPRRFAPIKLLGAGAVSVGVLLLTTATHAQIPCGGYEVAAIIQAPECPPFGFPPTIGRGISEPIDGGLPYVVGHVQSCVIGPDVAFLWTPGQGIQLIPTPPGTIRSWAFDISPDGNKIAGSFDLGGDGLANLGFLYDYETDKFTNLGTLPGGNWSEALAINANGDATGFWGNNAKGPLPLAFVWRSGEMADISGDFGTPNSHGNDINANGQVTGWMGTAPFIDSHAFIWDDGNVLDLGVIPGGITAEAFALNNRSQVVGRGVVKEVPLIRHAFVWADGEMVDIGVLPGFEESIALDVNDDGVVVGGSEDPGLRAFVWQDAVMMALSDLISPDVGLNVKSARAINQGGQITGSASGPDGIVAFVLTPVEPLLADLDGDCTVGVVDLLILLDDWGPCQRCPSDLNGDGIVGVGDLLILLANWG